MERQITSGLEEMGNIRLELLLCLFIFSIVIFICLCKGIKVSGKIVYVTAIFPYIALLIFLVRGVTLPGSSEGIKYFVIPQWEKMLSTKDTNTDSLKSSTEDTDNDKYERENWSGRLDFFLTNVGYAVGIGNIWRFPYLCYKNGGGAFLIPYLSFLVIGALPLFFLEYAISQFSSSTALSVWNICPLFKGVGYSMLIMSGITNVYYNVMMAWVLFYLYQSFTSVLPWSTCNNHWNTRFCFSSDQSNTSQTNSSLLNDTYITENKKTASEEFFRNHVLQITSGLEEMGNIRLELLLCLFIFWVVIFICLCKGIKVSGKIVYVTAIFPYIVLLIFLVRGVTLPGSSEGIKYFVIPQWDKMLSTKVWGEAALQIFFSSSMGWGGLLTFASYNKFHHNMYRDAMIIPFINSGTSIFAGFVTFSVLGFMAREKGMTVDEVATQGPGLAFITYPEAISRLPVSPLWAVLFFLMLFTVGIDTQFGSIEVMTAGVIDEYPKLLRSKKVIITAVLCIIQFLLGIPFCMQGGIYILQIVDWYCTLFSVMLVCILECITVGWIYGIDRMYRDIEMMLGYKPCLWWSICWKFITPTLLAIMLTFNMSQLTPVSYGTYQYPLWAILIGWIIGMASVVPIPIQAVIGLCKSNGSLLQRIKKLLKPTPKWGPALEINREKYFDDLYQMESTDKGLNDHVIIDKTTLSTEKQSMI